MKLSSCISNILRPARLLALFAGALALVQHTAHARDQVPFRLEWNSKIETIVDFPIATVIGTGEGLGTHLGRLHAQSVAEEVNLETGAGVATYRYTAANGDEVLVDFVFSAIPTSPTVFAVSGTWQIIGGTGRFEGASGSGTYQGGVEFTGPNSALGHFGMLGTISSPGSLK